MTEINTSLAKQASMRSSTTILKSILTKDPKEPGMLPFLTGTDFRMQDSFVANIARLVLDMRAQKATGVSKATVPVSAEVKPGKTIDVTKADAGKIYGDSGNDKITVKATRVDYVSARGGDDTITITATGDKTKTTGMAAIDSGSVTRIYGGDGKDAIDVTAEQLVADVQGGNGDDSVSVKSAYASRITGGNGNDKITVNAQSVDGVEGNTGDDQIDITATVDKDLDETLARSTDSGGVRNVSGGVGKDTITIRAEKTASDIDAGSGDDKIDIRAQNIYTIDAGSGDDHLDLAGDMVMGINSGSGNDAISVKGRLLGNLYAGYGNDSIDMRGETIMGVSGDSGDDVITLTATPSQAFLDGIQQGEDFGTGTPTDASDSKKVTPRLGDITSDVKASGDNGSLPVIMTIDGGNGNDKITIENRSGSVTGVNGGNGNDEITIKAVDIGGVSGGKGDDKITLQSLKENSTVSVYFAEGDGNDTITTTSALEIHRYSADGTKELGLKDATLTKVDNATDTYKLTFKGSKDSITIHFYEPGIKPDLVKPVIDGNTVKWVSKTDTKA